MNKLKQKANELLDSIPAIYLLMKDKQTSIYIKILGFMIVAYFVSPIDLIPDFIPVLGYLDDLIILPVLVGLLIKLVDKQKFEEYRLEAKNLKLENRWYYTLISIITIVIIIIIIVLAVRK